MNQSKMKETHSISLSDWLVLPTIVFSQFAGTSLWFVPNAVVSQVENFQDGSRASTLVSCVQVGFIVGTLILTYFSLADRWSAPLLFSGAALIGAGLNLLCIATISFAAWAVLRLLVGVCLAGIYPVGMKIAAMEYPNGLGARLGVLVGALTLGTAFPWLVRGISDEAGLPYEITLISVSALAVIGATLMALIMIPRQNGWGSNILRLGIACCFVRKKMQNGISAEENRRRLEQETAQQIEGKITIVESENASEIVLSSSAAEDSAGGDIDNATKEEDNATSKIEKDDEQESEQEQNSKPLHGISALKAIFQSSNFRAAAIGYFGHMWELYAFWAHMPSLVNQHSEIHGGVVLGNEALTSFAVIAIGAASCSVGGLWSLRAGRNIIPGSAVVAVVSLMISGSCCLLVLLYERMNQGVFLVFLLVWGSAVVADSAQFSSLTAMHAHPGLVGTSLTLTTSIGFAISIVSIQILGALINSGWDPGSALSLLVIGPAIGVYRTYQEWPLQKLCRTDYRIRHQ
jgi:MFS family permease